MTCPTEIVFAVVVCVVAVAVPDTVTYATAHWLSLWQMVTFVDPTLFPAVMTAVFPLMTAEAIEGLVFDEM